MIRTYQVEYFDRDAETDKLVPYGANRSAAHAYAKRMSDKQDGSAYVVNMVDDIPVGHTAYVFGILSDRDGDSG